MDVLSEKIAKICIVIQDFIEFWDKNNPSRKQSNYEIPIYHYEGSNKHNDYGLGFYCAQNLDTAKEQANRNTRNGYVNKYLFDERGLKKR